MLWELRPPHEHELRTVPKQICARIQSITANDYPTYGAGRGLWLDDIVAYYIWHVCVRRDGGLEANKDEAIALADVVARPVVTVVTRCLGVTHPPVGLDSFGNRVRRETDVANTY